MNIFRVLIFVLIGLFVQKTSLYAQSDYVITSKHDTIFCKIRKNGFNGRLQYKTNKDDEFINITPDSIGQYFISRDNETYILKELPDIDESDYVLWLEKGRVNLYEYQSVVYYRHPAQTYLYASKLDKYLTEIKHQSVTIVGFTHSQKDEKEAFVALFSDDAELQQRIRSSVRNHYSIGSIRRDVEMYNTVHKKVVN